MFRQLRAELLERQVRAENREWIPACRECRRYGPRPRPGNHRNHHARGGRNRRADQAGLVAYAARRMLVDFNTGDIGEVQNFSRMRSWHSVKALSSRSVMPLK